MRRILPLLFLFLLAGMVKAIKVLPWWALLAAPVAGVALVVIGLKVFGGRLLRAPFKAKGAVLRGARASVHSVARIDRSAIPPEPVFAADDDEPSEKADDPDEDVPPDWPCFSIDVTIEPSGEARTPFGPVWEPGELDLVRLKMGPHDKPEDDTCCRVLALEVEQEGRFQRDEGSKLPGAQRLRLFAAVRPGVSRLAFQYYFETFGRIALPSALPAVRAVAR